MRWNATRWRIVADYFDAKYNKSPSAGNHLLLKGGGLNDQVLPQPQKTRERIEDELLEDLQQKQAEWATTKEDNRDLACQRFKRALRIFNDFVLDNRSPKDSE